MQGLFLIWMDGSNTRPDLFEVGLIFFVQDFSGTSSHTGNFLRDILLGIGSPGGDLIFHVVPQIAPGIIYCIGENLLFGLQIM